jgi:hypothetical protein
MLATKQCAGLLEAMPDDADSAMIAGWRERMNGAFEAIKGMRLAVHRVLRGFVVVIAAGFTCSHDVHLRRNILKSANGVRFQQQALLNIDHSISDTASRTAAPEAPKGWRAAFKKDEAPSPK